MKILRSILLWFLALVITLGVVHYQRMTGPTYPVDGETLLGGRFITYNLKRSHSGADDHEVRITVTDPAVVGYILWKRYKLDEPTRTVRMRTEVSDLVAYLPGQPPAGKLEYQVRLSLRDDSVILPPDEPAVIRFKGDVPMAVLIPHVLLMFGALLVGMRTALSAALNLEVKTLAWVTLGLVVAGGLIFGPIVQKYAFGAFWTGLPFGEDLTDNKTAVMALGWLAAVWVMRGRDGGKRGRWWVIAATVLMFTVYMIPHSLRGSELDYSALPPDSLEKISRFEDGSNSTSTDCTDYTD